MKLFLFFLLTFSIGAFNIHAQGYFMQDVSGKPIKTNTYSNISGSPYLFENWMKGTVTTLSGKTHQISALKLDLVTSQLLFKGSENEMFTFSEEIAGIVLQSEESASRELVFKKGFSGSKGLAPSDFVQVLAEGKTTLLKKTNKIISESRAYNSSTVDKSITTSTTYFFKNEKGELLVFSLSRKNFIQNFSSHQEEIKQFLEANKLNWKDDGDLVKVVAYYNAL